MRDRKFVPTHQQVVYQQRAIAGLSIKQMERELKRRGCRWGDVAAPPEGFYRDVEGDVPPNWARARVIRRGDVTVGCVERPDSLERVLRSALAHVRAQDEFKDRNDWPPGMEPPKGPVPAPWPDVHQAPQWLIRMYQDMVTFEHRPDPLPSFDGLMDTVSSWREGKDWVTDDSVLMEEFEVAAFPEDYEPGNQWRSLFHFSKVLTGPDDRIVWPGDPTWIDAPVGKVGFFFLPEEYWLRHVQRETTHNPPVVDLKWPWKRHVGVVVD